MAAVKIAPSTLETVKRCIKKSHPSSFNLGGIKGDLLEGISKAMLLDSSGKF
ncbi:MAG: hypothetical protein K2X66_03895 [Cyanobacteria bacterium]|nr:hypothetical protein [Cyanobacteriota bacterium]